VMLESPEQEMRQEMVEMVVAAVPVVVMLESPEQEMRQEMVEMVVGTVMNAPKLRSGCFHCPHPAAFPV